MLTALSRERDTRRIKTEVYRGRDAIEKAYGDVFKGDAAFHARNTIGHVHRIAPDVLVITGHFEPDTEAGDSIKVPFAQVRVKQGDVVEDREPGVAPPARQVTGLIALAMKTPIGRSPWSFAALYTAMSLAVEIVLIVVVGLKVPEDNAVIAPVVLTVPPLLAAQCSGYRRPLQVS